MRTEPDRPSHLSRRERIASIAAATALAVASAFFALSAARPRFEAAPADARSDNRVAERLTYVVARTRTDPPAVPSYPARAITEPVAIPRAPSNQASNHAPPVASSPGAADTAATPAATGSSTAAATVVGAPIGVLTGGIAPRSPAVISDSSLQAWRSDLALGLATGRIKIPPLTQGEIDAKARAEALAIAAARGTGSGLPPIQSGGGASVPLPFGGPSRKQRERERAQYAEAMRIMARVQRKADSLIAARRQRQADSLVRLADSAAAHRAP